MGKFDIAPEQMLRDVEVAIAQEPTPENAEKLLRDLEAKLLEKHTRELDIDRLAQARVVAKTLITIWNSRDDVAIECAAELRGALVAIGVLSPADYKELLHATQR